MKPAQLLISAALLSLVTPTLLLGTAQAAETASCSSFTAEVQQLVKPSTDASLLTKWAAEAEIAGSRFGFTEDKGVLAGVAEADGTGLSAIWRLYRGGDFVWAVEGADADSLVAEGYAKQFIDFYAATEPVSCLSGIYRLQKGDRHRMADATERNALVAQGWTVDKLAFYADVTPKAEPAPDPDPQPAPDPAPGTDTKFSIAVIPDTQNEVVSATDNRMANRSTWLANNKSRLDLRYAVQIGDLVNWGAVAPEQFTRASEGLRPMEAAMPWSGAIGNHDTGAVCVGGGACVGGNANIGVRDTVGYNRAFPVSRFPNVRGTFEPNKIDNAWQTFNAGGVDWLVLNLELWPRTSVVTWAAEVVKTHPDHNVIINTHAYLEGDGSISGSNGGYGANSPRYIYDRVVKPHANVKLVLSGHVGDSASRVDIGDNGNKVVSVLQAIHSSTNPVRLMEIDTAAGTVTSEVYAPKSNIEYPAWATSHSGLTFVG